MAVRQFFLGVVGLGGGILVSAGVFTVLLAVGLVPRFAGKTHTNKKVFLYEEMVVFGTLTGDFLSVFERFGYVGARVRDSGAFGANTARLWGIAATAALIAFGLFSGVFVGCLALAIAEMLDSIPILTRRIGYRHGLGIMVLAIALGKLAGSLLYFALRFFETG